MAGNPPQPPPTRVSPHPIPAPLPPRMDPEVALGPPQPHPHAGATNGDEDAKSHLEPAPFPPGIAPAPHKSTPPSFLGCGCGPPPTQAGLMHIQQAAQPPPNIEQLITKKPNCRPGTRLQPPTRGPGGSFFFGGGHVGTPPTPIFPGKPRSLPAAAVLSWARVGRRVVWVAQRGRGGHRDNLKTPPSCLCPLGDGGTAIGTRPSGTRVLGHRRGDGTWSCATPGPPEPPTPVPKPHWGAPMGVTPLPPPQAPSPGDVHTPLVSPSWGQPGDPPPCTRIQAAAVSLVLGGHV